MTGQIIPNLEMMRTQMNTLFVTNERNEMVATNNIERDPAPRLALGRTTSGNLWRLHENILPDTRKALTRLLEKEPPLSSKAVEKAPVGEAELKTLLEKEASITRVWSGPAFYFSTIPAQPEGTVHITRFNMDVLEGKLAPWSEDVEAGMPLFASLENGKAAAVCGSVRQTPRAHEAGVETMEHHRRKGHATRAVSAWANFIAAENILPLYSTSWDNVASRAITKKLDLTFYGSDFQLS